MKARLFILGLLLGIVLMGCTNTNSSSITNSKSVSVAMVEDAVMPSTTIYITHVESNNKYGKILSSNGTKFLIASLFAKNTSSESISIDASNFKLTDGKNTYEPITQNLSNYYEAINNTQYGPKIEKFGVVLFELPESISAKNDTLPGWKLLYENDNEKATFDLSERKGKLLSDGK
ncbi:DUF4352 domain-containing protein [Paenibacillus cymbidii]|uniref:DUF4352 domain-containing protein n=1 Tax=Paenibacillus cymbidii TaxID=1639034 RepID=UPI0010801C79|nr:DUF4352 domain-containing protein [Paenibacillus cymbidii]